MDLVARLNAGETLGDRILKVDHAGEHGAVNIYRGQIFVSRWRAPAIVAGLHEFRRHEERHRALFADELARRGVRRCRSYRACGLGGLLLGLVTGLCGPISVAATTVAVEKVVLRHLDAQMRSLRQTDVVAFETVSVILHDERTHHDRAALDTPPGRFWTQVLMPIVSGATEAVIWLGMKL